VRNRDLPRCWARPTPPTTLPSRAKTKKNGQTAGSMGLGPDVNPWDPARNPGHFASWSAGWRIGTRKRELSNS